MKTSTQLELLNTNLTDEPIGFGDFVLDSRDDTVLILSLIKYSTMVAIVLCGNTLAGASVGNRYLNPIEVQDIHHLTQDELSGLLGGGYSYYKKIKNIKFTCEV